MNVDIAVISVVLSSCVALAGILATPLLNVVVDAMKWRRERKAAELRRFETVIAELLDLLAKYQTGAPEIAAKDSDYAVYSNLLTKYYAWEIVIWAFCRTAERERLKQLRTKFENIGSRNPEAILESYSKLKMNLYVEGSEITREILTLAQSARDRIG